MSINARLQALYCQYWPGVQAQTWALRQTTEPTAPFLLSVPDEAWERSTLRVMYVGQETAGWMPITWSPERVAQAYVDYWIDGKDQPEYRKSILMRHIWQFQRWFATTYPEAVVFDCWNNLNKIGKNGERGCTGVDPAHRAIERETFAVLREEVDIIDPHVVLFFTGPDRDDDIRFHFPDADFSPVSPRRAVREMAAVRAEGLPIATMRLYHPNYLKGYAHAYRADAFASLRRWLG